MARLSHSKNELPVGTVVTFYCHLAYHRVGPSQSTCEADYSWFLEPAICGKYFHY